VKFNTPGQTQEIGAFLRLNLQQLAAGLGLPEHLLSGDLTGANYSSLRAGLLPFRQRVEQVQYGTFVPQLLRPIWRRVVTFGVLSGELAAPDFESNPRAYLAAEWLPPKPMQVDPLKDVQATVAELEAGLTSRRKAVAERGWALEDLDSENAADPFIPKRRESDNAA
jgi:lambda family phage portal protein